MENCTSWLIVRAFASASPDYINEKTNYCLKADLYHCTMKALNLPRTNGYSCAINKYGMTSFLVWQRNKMEREFSPIIVKQINVVLLRL